MPQTEPQTDDAALFERLRVLLTAAGPETMPAPQAPADGQSLLAPPMAALNAPPRSFAEVYGADGQLLVQLQAEAGVQGMPELAALLAALDTGLRDGTLSAAPGPTAAPRLSRYVYPVV
ncbi:hypothetical protein [Puniceibacterium confluentis]|uniref:hypothetical protein n=1 Tax=Puniceibacterium confluentis TaxID=1958944 RepID=UPI0016470586|nr:hypothetical protein [Puniceibacterium confluentis]